MTHTPNNSKNSQSSSKDKATELAGFLGKHFIYTYENGWMYEWYCRNENSCDYRVLRGKVAGRWVTKQKMSAVKFDENMFKVDWHEPTGTCVSLLFNLKKPKEQIHGTIFFPQWIGGDGQHPEKTILYQNEFIGLMEKFRDEGPAYPYVMLQLFATINKMTDPGVDNDDVINKAPGQIDPRRYDDYPPKCE